MLDSGHKVEQRNSCFGVGFLASRAGKEAQTLLKGSWDLVTRVITVITKVTILRVTYNPTYGTYNLTY